MMSESSAEKPPVACHRQECGFYVSSPPAPSTHIPKAACHTRNDCLISHLQASTLASIVSLVITALFIWKFIIQHHNGPMIPILAIGATYLSAILYFFVGALNIEDNLSPEFHQKEDFPIYKEFIIRCLILTLVTIATGELLLGFVDKISHSADKAYSPMAIGFLLGSQSLYLIWDLFVYRNGNDNIRKKIKNEFLFSDIIGLLAAALVFWMVLAMPTSQQTSTLSLANTASLPNGPSLSLLQKGLAMIYLDSNTLSYVGGMGALLYLFITLFGPQKPENWSVKFKGGVIGYMLEGIRKMRCREFR